MKNLAEILKVAKFMTTPIIDWLIGSDYIRYSFRFVIQGMSSPRQIEKRALRKRTPYTELKKFNEDFESGYIYEYVRIRVGDFDFGKFRPKGTPVSCVKPDRAVSLLGNVSSGGVEPVYASAYHRKYRIV